MHPHDIYPITIIHRIWFGAAMTALGLKATPVGRQIVRQPDLHIFACVLDGRAVDIEIRHHRILPEKADGLLVSIDGSEPQVLRLDGADLVTQTEWIKRSAIRTAAKLNLTAADVFDATTRDVLHAPDDVIEAMASEQGID
jgi:hypothetical protein